jgi:Raf kinase inhibitor-like YbhB/YbcL family protein
MRLTSTVFADGDPIPSRYTCDGDDISPPLEIHDLPEGTVTLALIMDDPDAPAGTWDHWVAYDIPPTPTIAENVGALGIAGRNSWRRTGYGGPCPPRGEHRYFFRVFALDTRLGLREGSPKKRLLRALEGHVLAEATLTGRYAR